MAQNTSQTLAANGSTTPVGLAGRAVCTLSGTFGGGTVILEYSPNNGTAWVSIPSASYTAATVVEVACGLGGQIRATLSGATGPTLLVTFGRLVS